MLVRATRTVSVLTMRALFYGGLFVVVVMVHLALTGALRAQGLGPSVSLILSGCVVLAVVLVLVNLADWLVERRAAAREMQRLKQGLPGGAFCVVWRGADNRGESDESSMPWQVVGPLHARYPKLARRLGVEGVAVVEFEVSAEGRAKNIHCVQAWPSDVFYEAAREALAGAHFTPKEGANVRYGASFRMPFVFRIAGAAKLLDAGRRARPLRPGVRAAAEVVEKLRRASARPL